MIVYFSGGSPIVETSLNDPAIMLSAYVNARNWRPDARMRKLLKIRRTINKRKGVRK